jgi:hypothetical protein
MKSLLCALVYACDYFTAALSVETGAEVLREMTMLKDGCLG